MMFLQRRGPRRAFYAVSLSALVGPWFLGATPTFSAVQTRSVALPPWASGLVCKSGEFTAASRPTPAGPSMEVACSAPTGVLNCDGDGVEPVSVQLQQVCRSGQLPLSQARAGSLRFSRPLEASLEWLEVAETGVSVVASRRVTLSAVLPVLVSARAERYLRVHTLGASPVTVPAKDVIAGWEIPRPAEGGELLVSSPAATVSPKSVRIVGTVVETHGVVGGLLRRSGLPAGGYRLLPVYDGDVAGAPVQVSIVNGSSNFVRLPPQDVGAARISAVGCRADASLQIRRVAGGPERARVPDVDAKPSADCRWTIGGLPPGQYSASLTSADGSLGRQTFVVERQAVSSVALERPTVFLSGRVSYNGARLPGVTVTVAQLGGAIASAQADSDGRYRVSSYAPGPHSLTFYLNGNRVLQTRLLNLKVGENQDEWAATGGRIIARVIGARAGPTDGVRVVMEREGTSVSATLVAPRLILDREGLPVGIYRVSATEPSSGLVSESVINVVLSPSQTEAMIDIPMIRNQEAAVQVADGLGRPIDGVVVSQNRVSALAVAPIGPGDAKPGRGQAEGRYPLSAFPPGTRVQLRMPAPYVPSCVMAPRNSTVRVTASRGRSVVLEFVGPSRGDTISDAYGQVEDMRGAECGVPLSQFSAVKQPSGGDRLRFLVSNFPDVEQFRWRTSWPTPYQATVVVPKAGPVVLTLPRPPAQQP